jgi:membrane-associated protease RseP (regulator of RpoE activity)
MKNLTLPGTGSMIALLVFCATLLSAQTHAWNDAQSLKHERAEQRLLLGIYQDFSKTVDGIAIREVIKGKGAEASGLRAGDVIQTVDGKKVTDLESLRSVLTGHKADDRVSVGFLREDKQVQATVSLSTDTPTFRFNRPERDPCALLIGVYSGLTGPDGKGVKVTGIIEGTPASQNDIRQGDVILALDGRNTNSYQELCNERDKHKPGDAFRLTILRNETQMVVKARFWSCGQTPTEVVQREAPPSTDPGTLTVESLELYPNPTSGPLNIRFEATAMPTTVTIVDAVGKTVYNNKLNDFSGQFNEQLNLGDQKPGVFTLSIQQGEKRLTKKIVLTPRA